jgi:hypothetical protein
MPANTGESIAECELNKHYIRGLYRRTINNGKMSVQVYRVSLKKHPKRESRSEEFEPKMIKKYQNTLT